MFGMTIYQMLKKITNEYCDVVAIIEMLQTSHAIPLPEDKRTSINLKKDKVEHYFRKMSKADKSEHLSKE